MKTVRETERLLLCQGEAAEYDHPTPDLVLTNPYGPLPRHFAARRIPMLLHQWFHRAQELAAWAGCELGDLKLVGLWNREREAVWTLNVGIPTEVYLGDLAPTEEGWWPLELPERLLTRYGAPGLLVWDGFCGRGTGGKAALSLGMRWVGVDRRPEAIAAAIAYLELP